MTVFLTGASGYIGSAVAEALATSGHSVIGLARNEEKAKSLEAKGYRAHIGDINDFTSLAVAAKASDGVIHAATGAPASTGKGDTDAVEAMLDALEGSGKPFLYTSGVWVMGDTGGRLASEWSPLDPAQLVEWRPAVERRVIDTTERKIRGMVIRPAMVYGHHSGLLSWFMESARVRGSVRFVGTGANHWSFVHVDDLARMYVLALEKSPAGELFVAAQGSPLRTRDVALAAAKAAGVEGKIEPWPVEEARKEYGPMADALILDQRVGSTKAGRVLGWTPREHSVLDEIASWGKS